MFQLDRLSNTQVEETADMTFYTRERSVCLLACFDFAQCEVAVYDSKEDKCQLFTSLGIAGLTPIANDKSDVYFRTCQGYCYYIQYNTIQYNNHASW